MSKEQFSRLTADLGEAIGLPDLTPDEHGVCALLFNDGFTVEVIFEDSTETVQLCSDLGTLPEDQASAWYPLLLEANALWSGTGGATIGVLPESRRVLVAFQQSIHELDAAKLTRLLEHFGTIVESWMEKLDREPLPSQTASDDDPMQMMNMRV